MSKTWREIENTCSGMDCQALNKTQKAKLTAWVDGTLPRRSTPKKKKPSVVAFVSRGDRAFNRYLLREFNGPTKD